MTYAISVLLFNNIDVSVVDVLEVNWKQRLLGVWENLIHSFRDCEGMGVERNIIFFCGGVYWLSACARAVQV